MKRILILPVAAFVIAACATTKYIWQSELAGPVVSADIQKIADDRYIVSKSNLETLAFYEMNSAGDLQPVGQQIPVASPYSSLRLHWLDNNTFFAERNFGVIAHGSIEGGLQWQLDNAAFNALVGLNIPLSTHYRVKSTSQRTGLVYGSANMGNPNGMSKYIGMVAEFSEQGHLLGAYTDPKFSELTIMQEHNDTYMVRGRLTQEQQTLLGYAWVLQQRNRNGDVLFELPLQADAHFVLAMNDRLFIAMRENDVESMQVLDWNGNQMYTFPISSRNFYIGGEARQTGPNELLLTTLYDIEKRTLDGQLIWYHTIDHSPGLKQIILDSGLNANTIDESLSTFNGAELEIKKAENGDLLFKGTGKYIEKNLPAFEVINPLTGNKRTIRQNGSSTQYKITSCSIWCSYEEVEHLPGVCAIHDIELLEDGSLITVGSHCNSEGTTDRLQVTRY